MPLARIVTRDYEEARPLCDRLRELGYTVEVFAPGQLRLSEVDLEIQVERVPLDKATRLAARRARSHQSTVYVDRDLYAETSSRPQTAQSENPISETTPEPASAEPSASPRLDAPLSITPAQHEPANPIEAASVTPEIVPAQAPSAVPSAGWKEKIAGWREQHAAAQEERRLIREKEDELRRQRRATEEARRALAAEQRRHAEEEERRRREQELLVQRQREEEERLHLLAEQQRVAAERARLAEEQRRAEAERLRLTEEQRRIEEERQRIAADARRRVEEERRRVAAEEQRQAEEARAHEERLARERQAAPPVWSQSTAEIALPAAASHADRVPPPPSRPPVSQTPHAPRRRAPRISRPAAAPDRRRQWEQAALFASVVALILMIGFALAMRQSTPFSSSSNLLPQNAVEQQVPFGPATATPPVNSNAQRPQPRPAPPQNSAGAAPRKPSPAAVRRTPREEYIAPDEVVVHHYPQRHPPAATNSAGVRHISDMQ